MRIFEPLTHKEIIRDYLLNRAGNIGHPRARRYATRYRLFLEDGTITTKLPLAIENLVGLVRNRIVDRAANYRHGRHAHVWIKKGPWEEGPRISKEEPEHVDYYRKVLVLNRTDLLLHTLIATRLRIALKQLGYDIAVKRREDVLAGVSDLIRRAVASDRPFYLKCDIVKFGSTFNIDAALSTLCEALGSQMDPEDRVLLTNVYESFRRMVGEKRCSGSPIDQLLAEWMLFRFERELRNRHPDLFEHFFVRSGEDIVCALPTYEEGEAAYEKILTVTKGLLGCELHELTQPQDDLYDVYGEEGAGKSVIRRFEETPGLDFCGYEYGINRDRVTVLLRRRTFEKIKNRIAECSDGGNIRYHELPHVISSLSDIRFRIGKLNNYFGFYQNGESWKFSRYMGVTNLFTLPFGLDDQGLREQAHRLNHYMLRRLRHLHLRNLPNEMTGARMRRETVDKSYREAGLRTLIDGINKIRYRTD